jgi:hypothetical protein
MRDGLRWYPDGPRVQTCPIISDQVAQSLALNPHRPTPPPAHTPPAVSSFEAFRTPASELAPRAVTGRRPKTLNGRGPLFETQNGRSVATAGTVLIAPQPTFEVPQTSDRLVPPLRMQAVSRRARLLPRRQACPNFYGSRSAAPRPSMTTCRMP